jgi:hypothetical protein
MAGEEPSGLRTAGEAASQQSASQDPGDTAVKCSPPVDWIEVHLAGEDGQGVPDEPYVLILADGSERRGKTDARGVARLEGLPKGAGRLMFPNLDKRAWEPL